MKSYITLYVPKSLGGMPRIIAQNMAYIAGGVTVMSGEGGWYDDDGKFISEEIFTIKSFAAEDKLQELYALVRRHTQDMLDMGEQSVMLEMNGEVMFFSKQVI